MERGIKEALTAIFACLYACRGTRDELRGHRAIVSLAKGQKCQMDDYVVCGSQRLPILLSVARSDRLYLRLTFYLLIKPWSRDRRRSET